jgi:DUF1680 family protein
MQRARKRWEMVSIAVLVKSKQKGLYLRHVGVDENVIYNVKKQVWDSIFRVDVNREWKHNIDRVEKCDQSEQKDKPVTSGGWRQWVQATERSLPELVERIPCLGL